MTIASGNSFKASDYNAIQSIVSNVLGASSIGYYQTVTSRQLTAGQSFTATDLTNLYNDINKCRLHQTGANFSTALLPTPSRGNQLRASDLSLFSTQASAIQSSSYTAYAANMTLTASALTVTRASTWGNAGTYPTIGAEVQADFGSNSGMAGFFNTGGNLRWTLNHPSTATPQDTSWNTFLGSLGTFDIHGGTVKTLTSTNVLFPLSSLTTSYQTIFSATSTVASYTANTVTINAKLNAASTGVVIQILLNDGHTNAYYDSVASGTKAVFSHLKSTVVMTGIVTPTLTTITNF